MGVVKGGRLGMPGIFGGAGAGIVTPVKIGGGSSAKSVEAFVGTTKSSFVVEGGPKIA